MIALPRVWQRAITHHGGPCVLPRGHPYIYIENVSNARSLLSFVVRLLVFLARLKTLPYTHVIFIWRIYAAAKFDIGFTSQHSTVATITLG